jgi:hypothetical protein
MGGIKRARWSLALAAFVACAPGCRLPWEKKEEPATSSGGSSGSSASSGAVKRVFFTSTAYDGNLGGISGADAKCASAASGANLGGTWKAFIQNVPVLGTDSNKFYNGDAVSRMDEVGPWYSVDMKKLVFYNKAHISSGNALIPILVAGDEGGVSVAASTFTWNGASHHYYFANLGLSNCSNWTSNSAGVYGAGGEVRYTWFGGAPVSCALRGHLVCFEQ